MYILVSLFWRCLELNDRVYRASVRVSKGEKMRHQILLPLGDPPTPWPWATEPCCPCVWSAARCSGGKNKNKIWHYWLCGTHKPKHTRTHTHLISGLISIVDSFLRHHFWGEEGGKFAKVDAIPQTLLQFSGRRQFLLQAGFHPPRRTLKTELSPGTYLTHLRKHC